jgi:hypothetical protein
VRLRDLLDVGNVVGLLAAGLLAFSGLEEMNRRGFLQLASGLFVAPAVVKAANIMRVVPIEPTIVVEQYTLAMEFGEERLGDIIRFRRWLPFKAPVAAGTLRPWQVHYIDTPMAGLVAVDPMMRDEILRALEENPLVKVLQGGIR